MKNMSFLGYSQAAIELLAMQIRTQRFNRNRRAQDIAERIGISRDLLRKIERGNPNCSIGKYFDCASILGVQLFHPDPQVLKNYRDLKRETLLLLPDKTGYSRGKVKDDF